MVASYDGNGGHTHPRYLFPGLAVLAVVVALGLDRLPGARRGLWIPAVALAQLILTGAAWGAFLTALGGRRPDGPAALLGGVTDLLGAGGVRWPLLPLGLAGALLIAAFALRAAAVTLLAPHPPAPLRRRGRSRPRPRPAGRRPGPAPTRPRPGCGWPSRVWSSTWCCRR
jgi:hypothetical protein